MSISKIKIVKKNSKFLYKYSSVPISFEVNYIYQIPKSTETVKCKSFRKKKVKRFIKDYDAFEKADRWAKKWDIKNWGIFALYIENQLAGGIVIAHDTKRVNLLECRRDLAFIWDIRVKPEYRRMGLGHILFERALNFAKRKKCTELRVETQNINVNACDFYKKMGMNIYSVNRNAYKVFPDEIQIIWSMKI